MLKNFSSSLLCLLLKTALKILLMLSGSSFQSCTLTVAADPKGGISTMLLYLELRLWTWELSKDGGRGRWGGARLSSS